MYVLVCLHNKPNMKDHAILQFPSRLSLWMMLTANSTTRFKHLNAISNKKIKNMPYLYKISTIWINIIESTSKPVCEVHKLCFF